MNKTAASSPPSYEVVVREEPPFVNYSKDKHGNISFSGFIIDLLNEISKQAIFKYKLKATNHHSYGHQINGRWDGLFSEINNGVAHIAAGPIPRGVKEEGNNIADFTKTFMSTNVNLLVKYPSDTERDINLMFAPYKAEVWVMIILAFVAVSLSLFIIGRFSPFEWARLTKEKEYRTYKKLFELKNSFFFAATTISMQGYKEAPRSIAGRILVCMWFMFALCVAVAYGASLASILTTRAAVTPRTLPFSSYDDLLRNKRVKLGAIKYSYMYSAMRSSNFALDGLLSRVFNYVETSQEWIQDVDAGVQKVKDLGGKYGLVMDSIKASYVAESNCDLINYGENLLSLGYCFAVRKNSPLRDRLNLAILSLRENGYLSTLWNKYFRDHNNCPDRPTSNIAAVNNPAFTRTARGLDMRDMAIPFLFLFLGILGAGAALAGEIYYKKKMSEKKDSDPKEREPLNAEAGSTRAPKTSPPPPPIYKVNNKLHETAEGNKAEPIDKSSIEIVIVDSRNESDNMKAKNDEDKESINMADETTEHSQNSIDNEEDK